MKEALPELGLAKAEFRVDLSTLPEPGPGGGERVEFLVSLNPGFEAGPLSRIASGGELSRIMLALKAILAEADSVPTLVFDEIDSGIGGAVALKVADKLRQVAGHHQVFVITHLPQLASRAHHQLSVEKGEAKGLASHTQHDRTHIFSLTQEGTRVRRSVLGDLVDRVFHGSPSALMATLLDVDSVTPGELEEMQQLLDARRAERDE